MTEEQKAKIKECKSPEEMLELARQEGYELTDEQLEEVSGGAWGEDCNYTCSRMNKLGNRC